MFEVVGRAWVPVRGAPVLSFFFCSRSGPFTSVRLVVRLQLDAFPRTGGCRVCVLLSVVELAH